MALVSDEPVNIVLTSWEEEAVSWPSVGQRQLGAVLFANRCGASPLATCFEQQSFTQL